jgi:hypothetical protein
VTLLSLFTLFRSRFHISYVKIGKPNYHCIWERLPNPDTNYYNILLKLVLASREVCSSRTRLETGYSFRERLAKYELHVSICTSPVFGLESSDRKQILES